MESFTIEDFKIFDIAGFSERMAAILSRIRPKLTSIGESLSPKLSELIDAPLYVHVAKHARRTVNPPDDTWAAFGRDARGYKKDVHFKVAISRHCLRFLFEAGPEYYAKGDWVQNWNRAFSQIGPGLRSAKGLGFFKNEHDEEAAEGLRRVELPELKKLGAELTRRRDGQFVIGRRLAAEDCIKLSARELDRFAKTAFAPMAPLFGISEIRLRALRA
jgi:uncharacterized protein YktB (UPF0637 family)